MSVEADREDLPNTGLGCIVPSDGFCHQLPAHFPSMPIQHTGNGVKVSCARNGRMPIALVREPPNVTIIGHTFGGVAKSEEVDDQE